MLRKMLMAALAASVTMGWVSLAHPQMNYSFRSDSKDPRTLHGDYSSEASSFAMTFDAAFVRPAGLITTGLGTGLWVLTMPFTAPARQVREARRGLIGQPARWTFKRPLGKGSPEYEERPLR